MQDHYESFAANIHSSIKGNKHNAQLSTHSFPSLHLHALVSVFGLLVVKEYNNLNKIRLRPRYHDSQMC
jgi:hypothetical protein